MFETKGLSHRISRSIRSRIARSAAESPDGPIAMYAWLWQSTGERRGRTMMPRPVRFAFIAASDLVSAGGWYVRARALRTSRSVLRWTGVAALAVVLGVSPALQVSGQDQDVEAVVGTWEGQLALPGGAQLTVVFTVERSEDGALTGTLGSPDQSAQTAPWSSVTFEEGTLTLVASGVPGSPTFSGTRSEDGTVISGTFSQSGNQLPLELTKQE